jgi:hypothetical protein
MGPWQRETLVKIMEFAPVFGPGFEVRNLSVAIAGWVTKISAWAQMTVF